MDSHVSQEFWRSYLFGFAEPTRLGIRRRVAEPTADGRAEVSTVCDAAETAALATAAATADVSTDDLARAAWGLVLCAYAGTDDVVFGATDDEPAAVALRVRLDHTGSSGGYLTRLRDEHRRGREQAPPAPGSWASWAGVPAGTPLYDSVVRCGRTASSDADGAAPVELLVRSGPQLELTLRYHRAELAETDARRLLDHTSRVLLALASAPPSTPLWRITVLSEEEQRHIVHDWNDTRVSGRGGVTIHELVERQVARTPDATAVVQGDQLLTFAELDHAAQRLAGRLAAAGVGPGDHVGLCMGRGVHTVVALLGVLKSGAAYVPLEPTLPADRIRSLLASLAVPAVVTDADTLWAVRHTIADVACVREVLWLGEPGSGPDEPAATPRVGWGLDETRSAAPARALPDDVAYVNFTSGSTGTPKGVTVTHAPVVNLIECVNRTFGMGPSDRVLFVTSLGFDLSVYDVFGVLAAGGSVRVASAEELRDPARLLAVLDTEPITFWDSAPAALQQVAPFLAMREAPVDPGLRLVFLSGDWIPVDLPDGIREAFPGCRVVALGGATEATIWSNAHPVGRVDPQWPSIPYGRPLDNARYYVLDSGLRPAPVGAPGDLYIGGDCLALGYAGDTALTATKFLPDPFGRPGDRMYRTGDRARYWADGTIEFLGRRDQQVKVRGFRIELGEIEATLAAHPDVVTAVAVVHGAAENAQLVAYAVPEPGRRPDFAALRVHLARHLPEYMVPAHVVPLDQVPVTPNGKLDRRALPDPTAGTGRPPHVEPETTAEKAVARLWSELLGVERIGVDDNFFDLGGHSMLIAQLIARLRAALDVEIPLDALLDNQTVRTFAIAVEEALLEQLEGSDDEQPAGR
ncbi:amino acid adenylation domain-containing protein [Micromonospora sp. B11E3]|uniref:non-ribosomal peptide synthetase n=1 Tax=Micromonospora sp. B11E3 TaxID=3153562 RepID=UPI00325CFC9B